MKLTFVILIVSLFAFAFAVTPVQKCPKGKTPEEYNEIIRVGNCKKPPCRLRKGKDVRTEFKFKTEKEIKTITNSVNALIVGLPFPFIGVDGTSACDKIFETDGSTKAGCPLQAGKEYIYKDSFHILDIYPILKFKVHWGLTGDNGEDVMCFEVDARITN